jgi:hypothetical protein
MVIVFHQKHQGGRFVTVLTERNGELGEQSFPGEVAAHCVCTLGRWIRSKTSDALRARIPDGADIAQGRSKWSFALPDSKPDEKTEAYARVAMARFFGIGVEETPEEIEEAVPF